MPSVDNTPSPQPPEEAWTLRLEGEHGIIQDLVWQDVPPLAILTGPNGAGKTQLLQALVEGASNRNEWESHVKERDQTEKELEQARTRLAQAEGHLEKYNTMQPGYEEPRDQNQAHRRVQEERRNVANLESALERGFGRLVLQAHTSTGSDVEGLDGTNVEFFADAYQSLSGGGASIPELTHDVAKALGIKGLKRAAAVPNPPPALQVEGEGPLTMGDIMDRLVQHPGLVAKLGDPLRGLALAFVQFREAVILHAQQHDVRPSEAAEALGPAPWTALNGALASAGFPYRVTKPVGGLDESYAVQFVNEEGTPIAPGQLSSGEKTLAGIVASLFAGQQGAELPKLLLLDEPDAHLHPSLVAQLLSALQDVIVGQLGVRVILTTHSPSMVALAPEGSVFVMAREEGRATVRRPDDRWEAVSLLTAGIVTVGPHTKQVFVEDADDVEFYTAVADLLKQHDAHGIPPGRLAFHPANKDTTERGGGGCTRVVHWVETMDAPYIHGLIDYDLGPEPTHNNPGGDDPARVHRIGRYAIENYLLDPTVLPILLSSRDRIAVPGFEPFMGKEGTFAQATSEEIQAVADGMCGALAAASHTAENWDGDPLGMDDPVGVAYIGGQTVRLPRWLIEARGKDLWGLVQTAFGRSVHVGGLIPELRIAQNLPVELANTLRAIAAA